MLQTHKPNFEERLRRQKNSTTIMSSKKKSTAYQKTAAFNQLLAADQEAESLQKILPATAVGPGSYKKGVSAQIWNVTFI